VLVINSALLWSSHIIHCASCGNSKQVFFYRNFMLCFTNIKSVSVVVCSVKQFSKPLCMFSVRETSYFFSSYIFLMPLTYLCTVILIWAEVCAFVLFETPCGKCRYLNQSYHVLKYLQLQNWYDIIFTWLTLLSRRQITWNLVIDTCTI